MVKRGFSLTVVLVASIAAMAAINVSASDNLGSTARGMRGDGTGSSTLDSNEQTHLEFMREEEKLARDVYITLGMRYPNLKIFGKIDDSEQRHTCAVCDMLAKYGIDDPNTNDNVGIFTGPAYGEYFTRKYTELVERGSIGAIEALHVGAYIEEMDMIDIAYCPPEIVAQANGIDTEADCGKIYTDNLDIQRLYESLLEGSRSHLRAFVRNIEKRQGEGSYTAQVLTQEEVNEILGR